MPPEANYAADLARANGFTEEDLVENAAGRVSQSQELRLARYRTLNLTIALIGLLSGGFLLAVTVGRPRLLVGALIMSLTLLALTAITGWYGFVLSDRHVQAYTGPVFRRKRDVSNRPSSGMAAWYQLGREGQLLQVRDSTVLAGGANHRVYYLRRSRQLLSIEPV